MSVFAGWVSLDFLDVRYPEVLGLETFFGPGWLLGSALAVLMINFARHGKDWEIQIKLFPASLLLIYTLIFTLGFYFHFGIGGDGGD
ncbi:MAG: hypothetical protein HQ519_06690 [Planctomycetes bacterium]|nr:hypothetical protein [Planctomycetota bacterium]